MRELAGAAAATVGASPILYWCGSGVRGGCGRPWAAVEGGRCAGTLPTAGSGGRRLSWRHLAEAGGRKKEEDGK